MSDAFLIRATQNQQVIFKSMQRAVGVRRQWQLLTIQAVSMLPERCLHNQSFEMALSKLSLSELERERSPTPIVSIPKWRQGESLALHTWCPLSYKALINKSRAKIVHWVSESDRPFKIVKDWGFQKLMKTGRLEYYIPSPETVSQDVKKVFVHVCKRIAKLLKVWVIREKK